MANPSIPVWDLPIRVTLSGRKRVAGEPAGMRPAPLWRLWTGVALATLAVWMIVAS